MNRNEPLRQGTLVDSNRNGVNATSRIYHVKSVYNDNTGRYVNTYKLYNQVGDFKDNEVSALTALR